MSNIVLWTADGKKIEIVRDDRPKIFRAITAFGKGFKVQMFEEGTMATSAMVGLFQGLKYKGDFRRGVVTAFVTDAVISAINGIRIVVNNWNEI